MIGMLRLLQACGILILVAPIVYTLGYLTSFSNIEFSQVSRDLLWVFVQAFLSATLSVLLGWASALSLVVRSPRLKWHLYFGIIPQFLPSLLMIFAYVKSLSYFGVFPQAYHHVIALHVLINIGLVSFLLYEPLKKALYRKLHLFTSLNLPRWKYLVLLSGGELKIPLMYIWVLVFSYCLTSFSIPLILSGEGVATSTEFLIYQKGFVEGDWSAAAFWGLLQVMCVALLFKSRSSLTYGKEKLAFTAFKMRWPLHWLGSMATLILGVSLLVIPVSRLPVAFENLKVDVWDILSNTALLASWTLLFYGLYFWSHVVLIWRKGPWVFYQKFWSLSPILMGVYLLALSSWLNLGPMGRMVLTSLVLASFIFPFTFKFWIWPKFHEVQNMKTRLNILGVPRAKAVNLVLIEFFKKEFIWSLGYVFLFVVGDFAITSILLSDVPTVGLSIKNYIFKYQLVEAQILSLGLGTVALVSLALLGGKRAFNSKL